MTIYDKILLLNEEQMAAFLYAFANDILDAFEHYVAPSLEKISEFLDMEVPNG